MPKILVTGGAGYIGSHTCHVLAENGYDVVVVDNLSRGYQHNVPRERLRVLSLSETSELARIMVEERVDAVVHFAAYIAVGESAAEPELYFSNNVGGSLSLFAAMHEAGVSKLVFSSTAAVYGTPESVPIPESAPYAPVSVYGESKVMVEKILAWLDELRGLRSVCLRYFNACGAAWQAGLGEEHEPETHLIPLLIRAIETGKPITLFGNDYPTPDGTCIRDYIHVMDLARAHVTALEYLLAGGTSDRFNCGTGKGHSVLEVLRAVEEISGRKVPYVWGARRAGDPAELVANSSRLQRKLGWAPQNAELTGIVTSAWKYTTRRSD